MQAILETGGASQLTQAAPPLFRHSTRQMAMPPIQATMCRLLRLKIGISLNGIHGDLRMP